ncbi:MAG: NAD-dependent epimerase/dehydratase family protein [Candidatus Micrarchaeota archaeon]|nr:NAD-dependent epimerase/dehydratase family protein [Candidatus Micrarchaeota archaeon]MDE1834141.1 NAD-dependent epimerase/dehydratase family protein [Candidatus Micrarchaeota archaeon]MDE1859532.1 NAD-dependent epimerase/dehydratase family protein [Candidatus Micrarchaeota archaeon]
MELKNKKIIVTGGAGFIGSNLVERLAKDNDVIVIDNLHTGSEANLNSALKSGRVVFKKADSGDMSKLKFDADIVYHLGMYSASPMYRKNPELLGEVTTSMIKVLEYIKKAEIPLVFASTSSIYNGVTPPHRENARYFVSDYYTEGRIFAERASELYNKLYGCSIAAMRFFSVYGYHEEAKKGYANLVTQFMWSMQKGEPPVIYGDGSQKRDFVFVTDVVEALAKASAINGFDVFNVGYGKNYTLNQMVDILNQKMGKKIKAKYIKMPVSNYVAETLADTAKAQKVLGFKAMVDLEHGIDMLLGSAAQN